MGSTSTEESGNLLSRFASLRQHQQGGRRSPHKPLLVLLALGRLAETGSSRLPWSVAEHALADLVVEFGPQSQTGRAQSAAYPFTRLRSDGVWTLDQDVPMDRIGPLAERHVVGQFERPVEDALRSDPALVRSVVRALVLSNFPSTVGPDVVEAVGLDPQILSSDEDGISDDRRAARRRRSAGWRFAVLQAWDRQCAFCGYDGQLGKATVGVDAAHVRWFAFDGPDDLDNGLALCVLHHKLFDLGALGLDMALRVRVSDAFTARTVAGRSLYELDGKPLSPRPGTSLPAAEHVSWHRREVFKGQPLLAAGPAGMGS